MPDLTHDELAHDLAISLSSHSIKDYPPYGALTWENVEFSKNRFYKCRPDVFGLIPTHNKKNWNPTTYEIKVNRSDWLTEKREEKWKKYLAFSSRVVIACPIGLVKKEELPQGLGLIVRNVKGEWTWVKRPRPNKEFEFGERELMNLVMKTRNPSPFEYWKNYHAEREKEKANASDKL